MLRRAGFSLMSLLTLFASARAFDMPITVESAMDSALQKICPGGTMLTCPVMDFLVSFGVVFSVLYLSVNLIPQAAHSDEAKKALNVFAVIAAFATAIYVYMMRIPFVSFIAPAMLFVVGLIITLTVISAAKAFWEKGKGGGPSWGTIMAIIGFMLIGIGIVLIGVKEISAQFPQANDIGSLMVTAGVILLIVAFLLWLAKGLSIIPRGGGGGSRGRPAPRGVGRIRVPRRAARLGAPAAAAGGAPARGAASPAAAAAGAPASAPNFRMVKVDIKKGLFDLYALVQDVRELNLNLMQLYQLVTLIGTKNTFNRKKGFFAFIGKEDPRRDFNKKFNVKASQIIGLLNKHIKIVKSAIRVIEDGILRVPDGLFKNRLKIVFGHLVLVDREFVKAKAEIAVLSDTLYSNKAYYNNRDRVAALVYKTLSGENQGLRGVLRSLRLAIDNLRMLARL